MTVLLFVGSHDDAYRYAEGVLASSMAVKSMEPSPPTKKSWSYERRELPQIGVTLQTVETFLLKTRKYLPLSRYLNRQPDSRISLTLEFEEIERIMADKLPASAFRYAAWWANDPKHHVQATSWCAFGWRSGKLDLRTKVVSFSRF